MAINKKIFECLIIGLPLVFTLGCLEAKPDHITPSITPSATPEIITSPEIFPNKADVENYIINQKLANFSEVHVLNFAKIEKVDSIYTTEKPYSSGGYVAVRMLVKNYTVLIMEYKDPDHLFIEANYSATSESEKRVFNELINYKLNNFYFGSGPLTPTKITFLNATYAEFKFISDWNEFHKYWIESYGTIDTVNNSIWIKLPPKP
jgi:hypothetical protein